MKSHYETLLKNFFHIQEYLNAGLERFDDNGKVIRDKEEQELLSDSLCGHIIPLHCGHTGQPSTSETYLMERHLRAAGFKGDELSNHNSLSKSPNISVSQSHPDEEQKKELPHIKVYIVAPVQPVSKSTN